MSAVSVFSKSRIERKEAAYFSAWLAKLKPELSRKEVNICSFRRGNQYQTGHMQS
jgi:hypothetical protein